MTWSITDLKSGTHESGNVALEAAVELTNPHEFNYSLPFPPFTLVTDDEVTLRPNASFPSVGAGEKVKETLVFETDVEPDIAGLSLVVGEQGKFPEVVPFAGGAEANPYPIEPTFKGKTKALKNMGTAGFDRSTVVTALGAQIDVDLPGGRASTGSRLVDLDVRMFTWVPPPRSTQSTSVVEQSEPRASLTLGLGKARTACLRVTRQRFRVG